jgi:hypothetical protein
MATAKASGGGYARGSLNLLLVAVTILAITLVRSWLRPEPEWAAFESVEGGFVVLVAGEPADRVRADEVQGRAVDSHFLTFSRAGVEYAVTYMDMPMDDPLDADQGRLLRQACEALATRVQGELMGSEILSVDTHPGRSCSIRAGDDSILRARTVLVGRRLYSLMAAVPESSQALEREVDDFFTSFRLTGSTAAAATD